MKKLNIYDKIFLGANLFYLKIGKKEDFRINSITAMTILNIYYLTAILVFLKDLNVDISFLNLYFFLSIGGVMYFLNYKYFSNAKMKKINLVWRSTETIPKENIRFFYAYVIIAMLSFLMLAVESYFKT